MEREGAQERTARLLSRTQALTYFWLPTPDEVSMSRTAARVRDGISAKSADWYRFPLTASGEPLVTVNLIGAIRKLVEWGSQG
jgi:hypothetical protein